jgi:hypothetical protein
MQAGIRLIHWNEAEAAERAGRLRALGYVVHDAPPNGPSLLKELAQAPPAALVIDLSRLPSQGRDVGVSVRQRKATRGLPLVFVGGEPEKVAHIRALLPDAVYTVWEAIDTALPEAIAHPPENPVVLDSVFAAYAGKPLAEKLGIRPGVAAGLVRPPAGFVEQLGELPAGARLSEARAPDSAFDVTVWFVRSSVELEAEMNRMAAALKRGSLWIAWQKSPRPRSGGRGPGAVPGQQHVRNLGLAAGLVDYKVCSIDETWTALCFARRATDRNG